MNCVEAFYLVPRWPTCETGLTERLTRLLVMKTQNEWRIFVTYYTAVFVAHHWAHGVNQPTTCRTL